MSDTDVTPEKPKAKALASGIEVWCAHERLIPIEELKPNPRNPNTHPDSQVDLLAKNIRYFGWRHNILVSKRSGCIVAGHGRLLAAKKLGVLRDSVALDVDKDEKGAALPGPATGMKTVGDKTFYMRDGYWTDSTYDQDKSPKSEEVTFGSNEYFDLFKKVPGISKYLAVGRQVIVVYQGHSYKVSFKQDA